MQIDSIKSHTCTWISNCCWMHCQSLVYVHWQCIQQPLFPGFLWDYNNLSPIISNCEEYNIVKHCLIPGNFCTLFQNIEFNLLSSKLKDFISGFYLSCSFLLVMLLSEIYRGLSSGNILCLEWLLMRLNAWLLLFVSLDANGHWWQGKQKGSMQAI